jgi:2-phosphoglycerate kinase
VAESSDCGNLEESSLQAWRFVEKPGSVNIWGFEPQTSRITPVETAASGTGECGT